MRRTRLWPSRRVDVVDYISKLMSRFHLSPSDLLALSPSSSEDIDQPMCDACGDNPSDEGFHEDCSIVRVEDLNDVLSDEEKVLIIKGLMDSLPSSYLSEIQETKINPRLKKDLIKDLPHELKYEVLSYLTAKDLNTCMTVSSAWFQICTYPSLWRDLYFSEGWTIWEDVMIEFEKCLLRMQVEFDFHSRRAHTMVNGSSLLSRASSVSSNSASTITAHDPSSPLCPNGLTSLYDEFFSTLNSVLDCTATLTTLKKLHFVFSAIARIEIGQRLYRSATFTPSCTGIIVQVDWRYLYINRQLLENNWRGGTYKATTLDGSPDVTHPQEKEGIYCVYFDRNLLATGSRDNMIRLFDMRDNYRYLGKLASHKGSVLCLQLDSRRGMLVSGSSDGTIKVWNLKTRQVMQTLRGHTESVLGLHFEGKYIVSCSRDATARVWELQDDDDFSGFLNCSVTADMDSQICSGRPPPNSNFPRFVLMHVLRGHRAAVNSVHFRGNTIATASGDRTLRLWNLMHGGMIRTIGNQNRGIACVTMAGKYIVTGSSDHLIKVYNMKTGEEVHNLRGHTGLVRTIQTDSSKIISGSYDQSIRVWDLKTGEMLVELGGRHDSKIFRVHRDQRRIISCCGNARIVVWDFASGSQHGVTCADGTRTPAIDVTFF